MMMIELIIDVEALYTEVAQTTSYTGAKAVGDAEAYDRVVTTDEDRRQLDRFFNECRSQAANQLRRVLVDEGERDGRYVMRLGVSEAFDMAQLKTMEQSLMSFFVQGITGKWFVFTNKAEAGAYAEGAASMLEDVRQKAFHKMRPKRPVYGGRDEGRPAEAEGVTVFPPYVQ